jgi:short-subunit dehydrogenase
MVSQSVAPGRTALVTGASSGIGHEFTKLLVRDGCDVVLVARDAPRLARIADEIRDAADVAVTALPKDLAEPGAAVDIVHELHGHGIEVDILINNAGFNAYGPFWETDVHQELRMLQVHVVTLTHLTKLLLPGMMRRRFGRILNVGTTGSFAPGPNDAVYCASKAYVLSFSEALAEELRGTGVTVTALCPGPTRTEFAERAHMADSRLFQGRLSNAEDVARIGYHAMMRGRTSVVVGRANQLMVFSLRFAPRDLVARMSKRLLSRQGSRSSAGVHQDHQTGVAG